MRVACVKCGAEANAGMKCLVCGYDPKPQTRSANPRRNWYIAIGVLVFVLLGGLSKLYGPGRSEFDARTRFAADHDGLAEGPDADVFTTDITPCDRDILALVRIGLQRQYGESFTSLGFVEIGCMNGLRIPAE